MTRGACRLEGMRAAVIAAAILSVVVAPVALAANGPSSGVHIDPGSPAGKQYSVPIAVARGEASGQPPGRGSASPPSFGAGVQAATTPAVGTPRSNPRRATASRQPRQASRRRSTRRQPRVHRSPAAVTPKPTHSAGYPVQPERVGQSSWMPLIAGGLLVLLLGGGGGLALRRRL